MRDDTVPACLRALSRGPRVLQYCCLTAFWAGSPMRAGTVSVLCFWCLAHRGCSVNTRSMPRSWEQALREEQTRLGGDEWVRQLVTPISPTADSLPEAEESRAHLWSFSLFSLICLRCWGSVAEQCDFSAAPAWRKFSGTGVPPLCIPE